MILRTFFVKTDFSEIYKNIYLRINMENSESQAEAKIHEMYEGNPVQYESNKGLNLSYVEYSGNVIDDNVQKFEKEIKDLTAELNRIFNLKAIREKSYIRDVFHFKAFPFRLDNETVFVVSLGVGEPQMGSLKSKYTFMK